MRSEIKTFGASPISVAQVKAYAKIATSADDAVIADIIAAVVSYAESMTGRELRNNVWISYFDSFEECLKLDKLNVEQINSIKFLSDGAEVTVDNSIYYVNRDQLYSTVELYSGESWPSAVDDVYDAVQIEFTTSADMRLPELRLQMFKHIAHAYENRGDEPVDPSYGFDGVDYYRALTIPNF